nr:polysaccharide biosynthesis protein [Muribaculaceae bacterium]
DLQRIGYACLIGMVLSLVLRGFTAHASWLTFVRFSGIVGWTMLALFGMWLVRVVVKYMYDIMYTRKNADRVFVYGVRQGGTSIAKSIRNQDSGRFALAGFITDEDDMADKWLMGVPIYSINDDIVELMKKMDIKALFVSPLRSESLRENADFVNDLIEAGIKIYMVPQEKQWDGKSDIRHESLREVDIEDLLPRQQIKVDMDAIGKLLRGRRIFITGAAGSIGSEIVRQVSEYVPEALMLIDQAETPLHDIRLMMARDYPYIKAHTIVADIAHKERMEQIFSAFKPEFVFHAAAYKHVPMMEDNPAESVQNNIEGTRIVADLSVKYGAEKFVMVSTDKAVNPTNVMGCSKRICEIYVQSLDQAIKQGKVKGTTQFVTTRFGNVLGSNGSVIPLFREQIKKGGPLTVTHPDIIRYFMLIPEACKLVLEAGTMGKGGEIFVFDMGEPVKIVDLARRMIRLSGADIEIKFTGLRDGEKLYEEVLNEKETTLPTFHPKIKIAKVREYDYYEVNGELADLLKATIATDAMGVVRLMKQLVPEFKSQHSVYEQLDKKPE